MLHHRSNPARLRLDVFQALSSDRLLDVQDHLRRSVAMFAIMQRGRGKTMNDALVVETAGLLCAFVLEKSKKQTWQTLIHITIRHGLIQEG